MASYRHSCRSSGRVSHHLSSVFTAAYPQATSSRATLDFPVPDNPRQQGALPRSEAHYWSARGPRPAAAAPVRTGMIARVTTAHRCYDALMRTTVDLPEDLHRAATSLARDRGRSLSQTVSDLVRRALRPEAGSGQVTFDTRTGLPVVYVGVPVTTEMVRAAIDEE